MESGIQIEERRRGILGVKSMKREEWVDAGKKKKKCKEMGGER